MRDLNIMRQIGMRLALAVIGVGLLLFATIPLVSAAPAVDNETKSGGPVAESSDEDGGAWLVNSVDLQPGRAVFMTEGKIPKYRYFTLETPARLVVDLYGVRPAFTERTFPAEGGFSQMRVGTYQDRTRFVFDPASERLPEYRLAEQAGSMVLIWGADSAPQGAESAAPVTAVQQTEAKPQAKAVGGQVSIEAINFEKDNGKSQLVIDLSAPAQVISATQKGNIVHFGIKNATISQALRRTFDSSSFPSAVLRATPYAVLTGKRQDVRFAVELKGQVPYQLIEKGKRLVFLVEDGAFVEPAAAEPEQQLPVPVAGSPATPQPAAEANNPAIIPSLFAGSSSESDKTIGTIEPEPIYTGEKIQLVFDDADVRDIFQLIAEVSNLNIIVSDDVKGSISLRLINVPWDQALDLVMEIKDLGMLKRGNVVRILPREQIRAMEEAKFTAARSKEKLEDLLTEVIPVSYTALKNIEGPCKELMTERGKLTSDNRNKQVIMTDIPSVIDAVKKLIAILDTPERQVLIEARIVEANSNFSRQLGVDWGFSYSGDTTSGWNTNSSAAGLGGGFIIDPTDVIGGEAAGLGSAIQFGKIGADTITLDLQISALETSGNGKIISRPRISTLNGEKAKISQGTMIPYVSSTADEIKTEFVEAALSLEVSPVINPDDSVILEIKATNSAVGANVSVGNGEAPGVDTKEAETKVLVQDGETTVIGGIFVEDESFTESGVPFLRSIPYLGNLFKSTKKEDKRNELLIFITPRILN